MIFNEMIHQIKVEITQMFVNGGDTGGSFEFWGVPCTTKEEDSSSVLPPVYDLKVSM